MNPLLPPELVDAAILDGTDVGLTGELPPPPESAGAMPTMPPMPGMEMPPPPGPMPGMAQAPMMGAPSPAAGLPPAAPPSGDEPLLEALRASAGRMR